MMDEEKIRLIGEQFGETLGRMFARCWQRTVTVTDVDTDNDIATVEVFEGETLRVPLMLLKAETWCLKIRPTIGSTAVIAFLDGNLGAPHFVAFSEIDAVQFQGSKTSFGLTFDPDDDSKDELQLSVGDSSVRMTSDVIEFNGGDNDGLVLASKLTSRMNNVENDLNDLKTVFTNWSPVIQDGGASLKAQATSWASQRLQLTKDSDYTNDKITQ